MADNKKYYYMRLKENFFESAEMVTMESLPDGVKYSNILLKMYLKSLRDEGRLMLGTIPYSPEMIAAITRQNVETVKKALDIFLAFGLIEILDSGAIYMLDIQNFIGKSSTEADRQREYQKRIYLESCEKSNKKSTPEIKSERKPEREFYEDRRELSNHPGEEREECVDVLSIPASTEYEQEFEKRRQEQIDKLQRYQT